MVELCSMTTGRREVVVLGGGECVVIAILRKNDGERVVDCSPYVRKMKKS
jgi:hypothetical protein